MINTKLNDEDFFNINNIFLYVLQHEYFRKYNPDNKDHGANMGPTWNLSAPPGSCRPHLGPVGPTWALSAPCTLLSGNRTNDTVDAGVIRPKCVEAHKP